MLDELDAAFSLVDGFYLGRGPWASKRDERAPTHPLFSLAAEPLRRDGRFRTLTEETGLETFWHESRTQPDFRSYP